MCKRKSGSELWSATTQTSLNVSFCVPRAEEEREKKNGGCGVRSLLLSVRKPVPSAPRTRAPFFLLENDKYTTLPSPTHPITADRGTARRGEARQGKARQGREAGLRSNVAETSLANRSFVDWTATGIPFPERFVPENVF